MSVETEKIFKAHFAINVRYVQQSINFYRKMFGIEPAKVRSGYAKFDVNNPPLNFTLNEVPFNDRGALSHLGIQVGSTEDVLAVRDRWTQQGLITRDEMNTECCYALQDKAWAHDPDGNEWEVFVVLQDNLPEKSAEEPACCGPNCCAPAGTTKGWMLMDRHYNVLFLCTGNSARSIMAEAILNRKGRPNFTAYSAGSHPSGIVRPEALKQIEFARISTEGFRSKGWEEFAKPGAPEMDFVFTVCDNAANEVCPVWPGQPMTAHWGVPDPAAVTGTPEAVERAFRDAYTILLRRIDLFLCLPLATLQNLAIQKKIDEIGKQ
jgi:arsenate reductase (thioredoxin)